MANTKATLEGGGGRYTLFAEIASGGMASVHIGRLVSTAGFARTVAIKKLYPQFAKNPDFVAMFLDEARLAARIKHPNVVPTLDIVRDGDQLLLVMEYVQGETLTKLGRAVRAKGQAFDLRVASAILVGVLHGLHAAHEAKNEFGEALGIVHRDVSPQNVIVGVDGVPRVVDFGVAKAMGQAHETRDKEVKGKLPYMSPEQARGGAVTRLTDVWASGVLFFETLTGKSLFGGDNDAIVLKNVLSASVPDLATYVPDAPPALDAILKKALSRNPAERYPTARAMASAIEQAVPLALPSEVGEYVERACGDSMAKRAEQIKDVESASRTLPGGAIIPSSEFIADALWRDLPRASRPGRALPQGLAPAHAFVAQPTAAAPQAPSPPSGLALAPTPATGKTLAPPPQPVSRARWAVPSGGLLVAGAVLLFGGPLLVPGYAKQKAIEAAASRGITLSVGKASGGYSGVHFHDLTMSLPEVPGLTARVADVDVDLSWFRPVRAKVSHAEVSADGPIAMVLANLTSWYRDHRGGREEAETDGMRVEVPTGKLSWTRAFGEDGLLAADGISGDLIPKTTARLGDELHFTTSKLTLTGKAGALGPWRVDVEQDPNATTTRIAFDPPVPDGPNAIVTRMTTGKTLVDVNIARSPLYRLGVPPAALAGSKHPPEQADLKIHYTRTTDNRVDATLAAGLYGLFVPPMPGPTEVHLAGTLGGDGASPLEVAAGSIAVGPMKATLTGPVILRDDGVSGSLAWKAAPIPCAQLLPKNAQAASDLAAELGVLGTGAPTTPKDKSTIGVDVTAIAQAAGLAHVSGTLAAFGTLVFDTHDLAGTSFTVASKNTCGVALFGNNR